MEDANCKSEWHNNTLQLKCCIIQIFHNEKRRHRRIFEQIWHGLACSFEQTKQNNCCSSISYKDYKVSASGQRRIVQWNNLSALIAPPPPPDGPSQLQEGCQSGVPLLTLNLQYCCFYPHLPFSLYNTLTLCILIHSHCQLFFKFFNFIACRGNPARNTQLRMYAVSSRKHAYIV